MSVWIILPIDIVEKILYDLTGKDFHASYITISAIRKNYMGANPIAFLRRKLEKDLHLSLFECLPFLKSTVDPFNNYIKYYGATAKMSKNPAVYTKKFGVKIEIKWKLLYISICMPDTLKDEHFVNLERCTMRFGKYTSKCNDYIELACNGGYYEIRIVNREGDLCDQVNANFTFQYDILNIKTIFADPTRLFMEPFNALQKVIKMENYFDLTRIYDRQRLLKKQKVDFH